VLRVPDLDTVLQLEYCALTRGEQRGTITSLALLATPLLMELRIPLAFWAASTHCWFMHSFSSTDEKSYCAH